MAQLDYNNMLVAELKQELESIGLPISGKKSELIERLMAHSKEPVMISIEADLIDEESRYDMIISPDASCVCCQRRGEGAVCMVASRFKLMFYFLSVPVCGVVRNG